MKKSVVALLLVSLGIPAFAGGIMIGNVFIADKDPTGSYRPKVKILPSDTSQLRLEIASSGVNYVYIFTEKELVFCGSFKDSALIVLPYDRSLKEEGKIKVVISTHPRWIVASGTLPLSISQLSYIPPRCCEAIKVFELALPFPPTPPSPICKTEPKFQCIPCIQVVCLVALIGVLSFVFLLCDP